MKKVLLLLLLSVASNILLANVQQANWRWRKDNGNQLTATYHTLNENEFIIISSYENVRLRMEFYNDLADATNNAYQLQYSSDSLNWIAISNTFTTQAFVIGTSTFVVNDEPTTKQLVGYVDGQNNTFQAGRVREAAGDFTYETAPGNVTEHEWVLTPTSNILPNTRYYFRVDAAERGNVPMPQLRTASTLPVNISKFVAKAEGKKVKLQWSTVSEQNNDRFDVERSMDGYNWKVIEQVKGNGTTDLEYSYVAYDNSPSSKTNYYRLSQYDFDGKVKKSGVQMIKLNNAGITGVTVFPNPTRDKVRFALSNYEGRTLTATLTTIDGKIVHKEAVSVVAGGNNFYQLGVAHSLSKGNYVLRVIGVDLDQSTKVIVQ
jgi:hypothetical protein